MKKCTYCSKLYKPRPQVKNPISCNAPSCQKKRQRANEKDWHKRNEDRFDSKYHRRKRNLRNRRIKKLTLDLVEVILVGCRFKKFTYCEASIFSVFHRIFLELGLRGINKFWLPDKPS